jgi:hypothetical protein
MVTASPASTRRSSARVLFRSSREATSPMGYDRSTCVTIR